MSFIRRGPRDGTGARISIITEPASCGPLLNLLTTCLPRPRRRLSYAHTSVRSYATLAETRNARIDAFFHLANDPKPGRTHTILYRDDNCREGQHVYPRGIDNAFILYAQRSVRNPVTLPSRSLSPGRLSLPSRRSGCPTIPNLRSANCWKDELRRILNGVRSSVAAFNTVS